MCAKATSSSALKKKLILVSDEFYSDMSADGMIYAKIFRSPFPYGKITSMGLAAGEKFPEGYGFFSYKDLPGAKKIRTINTEFNVFCDGNIKYKGEPLGIICGPDKKIIDELMSKIKITLDNSIISKKERDFSSHYETLTSNPYTGKPLSQKKSSSNSNEDVKITRGLVGTKEISTGNTDDVFSDPKNYDFIVEETWQSKIQNKPNKEVAGAFCLVKNTNLHVYSSIQWISHLRKALQCTLDLADEKIITTRTNISSQNGNSIWKNTLICVQTSLAAIKMQKPVMMMLSRDEQRTYIENASPVIFYYRTAVDLEGNILAMEINIEIDIGTYNPFAKEILERLMIASTGIYMTKNLKIKGKIYSSNTPPTALNFSTIDSAAFFAIENQIQKISEVTGISPLELRLRNQNRKLSTQKNPEMPFLHDLGNTSLVLEAVCKKSDFNRKAAVFRLAEKERFENSGTYQPPRRGIGLACAFEGSGYFGSTFKGNNINIQLELTEEKKLIVNTIPPSNSIKEIWTKIICDSLGFEKKNITFVIPVSDAKEEKSPCSTTPEALLGSISIKTSLLRKCVEAIKKQKDKKLPLTVKKSLSPSKLKQWDNESFSGIPFFNTSFAACTVEVLFDEYTYREQILKICVVIDGGKILHIKAAENAVKTSIQKTLALLMDDDTLTCPDVSVQFLQSESEPKQIGHIIASILPAAFTSALSQALTKTVSKLPLQTDTLFKIYEPEA